MKDTELKELYITINRLINENVIRFDYYGSNKKPQLIQCLLNEVDNTIDISFRDNMKEVLEEIKKIINE